MNRFKEIKAKLKQVKNKVIDSFLVNKIESYKRLFSGNGSKEDADIVLSDLIQTYDVNQPSFKNNLSSEQIAIRAVIREPIERIKKFIGYSDKEIQQLISNINKNRNK